MNIINNDLADIGKKLRMSNSMIRESNMSRLAENTTTRNDEILINDRSLNNSNGEVIGSLFNNSTLSFCFNRRNSKLTNNSSYKFFGTRGVIEDEERNKVTNKDLVKEIDRLGIIIKGLKNENKDFKLLLKNKEKDVDKYRKLYFDLKKEFKASNINEGEVQMKRKENFRLNQENQQLKNTISDLTKQLSDLRRQLTETNLNLNKKQYNSEILEEKNFVLESELSSIKRQPSTVERINSLEKGLARTPTFESKFTTLDSEKELGQKKMSFSRKYSSQNRFTAPRAFGSKRSIGRISYLGNNSKRKARSSFALDISQFKNESSMILGKNYTRKYFLNKE
jgi:hypothetical protein